MNILKYLFGHKGKAKDFDEAFFKWLQDGLTVELPINIQAFCFNLFETNDGFAIELIGADRFSQSDPDWPCDEVFEFNNRCLVIPKSISGNSWEECLSVMTKMVKLFLQTDVTAATILHSKPIGIEFVDGGLHIVEV